MSIKERLSWLHIIGNNIGYPVESECYKSSYKNYLLETLYVSHFGLEYVKYRIIVKHTNYLLPISRKFWETNQFPLERTRSRTIRTRCDVKICWCWNNLFIKDYFKQSIFQVLGVETVVPRTGSKKQFCITWNFTWNRQK